MVGERNQINLALSRERGELRRRQQAIGIMAMGVQIKVHGQVS
jgi:hypothetical protein